MIKFYNSDVNDIYLGNDRVDSIYLGSNLIYSIDRAYIEFYTNEPFTFHIYDGFKYWDGNLYYSLDKGVTWNECLETETIDVPNCSICLRGVSNTYVSAYVNHSFLASPFVLQDVNSQLLNNIHCRGNITALLDYNNYSSITAYSKDKCFAYLFSGLNILECPNIPSVTLTSDCYRNMFSNTKISSINNITIGNSLATSCCYGMFYNCQNLTSVPENFLPATTLAPYCYSSMFQGCWKLSTLPTLPAENLTNYCYYDMFANIYGITSVPENFLPSTTLAENCYDNMFRGCRYISDLPNLPATTLYFGCYSNMFQDCQNLTSVPENFLPATTLAPHCYSSMFQGCTKLTKCPNLQATTLAQYCYYNMFSGCIKLTRCPDLPATELIRSCYSYMFSGCINLEISPSLSHVTTTDIRCCEFMFEDCGIYTMPSLPDVNILEDYCYYNMFSGCTNLINPRAIICNTIGKYSCGYMFKNCKNIKLYTSSSYGTSIFFVRAFSYQTSSVYGMLLGTGGSVKSGFDVNTTYYYNYID